MSDLAEKHTLDSNMQSASEEKGDIVDVSMTFTPEEEKQVLRKIDRTILPLICIVFFMQVSSSNLFNFTTSLTKNSTWTSKV